MLKIEEGKFYKTRDGRKVGPMVWAPEGWFYQNASLGCWLKNGLCQDRDTERHHGPLFSEWPSEETPFSPCPIRTITRREIVPGVYGRVYVGPVEKGEISTEIQGGYMSPSELRESAHLFNQLAEYLDSEGK